MKFDDRLTVLSWFDVSEESLDYDYGDAEREVGIFFAVNKLSTKYFFNIPAP